MKRGRPRVTSKRNQDPRPERASFSIQLVLFTTFALFGAATLGATVADTVAFQLISGSTPRTLILTIVFAVTATLLVARASGFVLTFAPVAIGAMVGVGVVYGGVELSSLLRIAGVWVAAPLAALVLCYFGRTYIVRRAEVALASHHEKGKVGSALYVLLLATGCFEAAAVGMNTAGIIAGPLLATNLLELRPGLLLGGMAISFGAYVAARVARVRTGPRPPRLSLLDSVLVGVTVGSLGIAASLFGIPLAFGHVLLSAALGTTWSKYGCFSLSRAELSRTVGRALTPPLLSFALAAGGALLAHQSPAWFFTTCAFALVAAAIRYASERSLSSVGAASRRACITLGAGLGSTNSSK